MLLPADKAVWDANQLLRLAVERLWILAGTTAETYRIAANLDVGALPWAELYQFRNVLAHLTPSQLETDRVWHESVQDLPRLLEQVRAGRL